MRRNRGRHAGMSTFAAGLIGVVVLAVFSYLAYTKFANPFANPYTLHATFANAGGVRPGSPVRIAGVNVGTVKSVGPISGCRAGAQQQCSVADVTMAVNAQGLPIHRDATFAIRPRIFLEGNFFVDVKPGTPSAPTAPTGYTFPIQQGVEPVQFDQVLTSLQSNTRHNLQILLAQYGTAVEQGGPSFNASIKYWLPAYRYSALVAHATLGIQTHDLSQFIAKGATVAGALDAKPQPLQSLITDFNTTADAFARQNVALEDAVAALPQTLAAATPALNALNATFPPLRTFARALVPGVTSTGPTIDSSLPFIKQIRLLVQPAELGGLASDLAGTVPSLAKLTQMTIPLMRDGVRPASSCIAGVIYPWSQLTLHDPNFNASNGVPLRKVYVEAVDGLPGLAGESRDFDANGPTIRTAGLAGAYTYSLAKGQYGTFFEKLTSVQPALPPAGRRPPLQPHVPCETQPPITTLSTPSGPKIPLLAGP